MIDSAIFRIATLLLAIATLQSAPPKARVEKSGVQTNRSQQEADKSQKKNPVEAPKVICNCNPIQEQPSAERSKEDAYNPARDRLYRAYLWFTIIGVCAALVGIGFIWMQNRNIKQQSEYLAEQINVQRRTARQWIQITDLQQHRAPERLDLIRFSYNILNKSQNPLWVEMDSCEANGQTQDFILLTYLVPDSPFPRDYSIRMDPDQIPLYEGPSGLIFNLKITVHFTDTFNQEWGQSIRQSVVCRWSENSLFAMETHTNMWRSEPTETTKQEQRTRNT